MNTLFHEDKQQICTKLREYLNVTSNGRDIETIVYEKVAPNPDHPEWYDEFAVVSFRERELPVRVNITYDSGTAIAKDVIKALFP